MPYAMTKSGTTYYLTYDPVGTLRVVADQYGNVVKRIEYDSFGNIVAETDLSFSVPFGFAGGLADRDTGLIRFGYRDYDPDIGRWTAKDPILFAGGDTDLYGYCLNDPVNWVDPEGLYTWPYTWKGWAGVTLSLAGLSVARFAPKAGGIIIGFGTPFALWDTIEGPIQAERDIKRKLKPLEDELDALKEQVDGMEKEGMPCQ